MKKLLPLLTLLFSISCLNMTSAQVILGDTLFGSFSNESFGDNVSFSDDGYYLAVGCPTNSTGVQASVRVFEYDDGTMNWSQLGDSIPGDWLDDFAYSTDIGNAGQSVIIGSPNSINSVDNNVQVWVYDINDGWFKNWERTRPADAGDAYGWSVDNESAGTYFAIGAPTLGSGPNGTVEVIIDEGFGTPVLVQAGQTLKGGTGFGAAVDLIAPADVVRLAVTSAGFSTTSDTVFVYEWVNEDQWELMGDPIVGDLADPLNSTPIALSESGDRLVVGFAGSSEIKVYDWDGTSWSQAGNTLSTDVPGDQFGTTVSITFDGNRIAVGAPFAVGADGGNTGAITIYAWWNGTWYPVGDPILGTVNTGTSPFIAGYALALNEDGSRLAAGTIQDPDDFISPGTVRVYDLSAVTSTTEIAGFEVDVFPNPTTDLVQIKGVTPDQIQVFDATGKVLLTQTNQSQEINLFNLPNGLYFLQITVNQQSATQTIIKQ